MCAKFRKLPDVSKDTEMEWSLFRSAIISSAAAGNEKKAPWWNQDVKKGYPCKERCIQDLVTEQVCIRFVTPVFRGPKNSKLS